MPELALRCACGNVQGVAADVDPNAGTRLSCCCDDCQSFAHYLKRSRNVLDQYGGTDIFQMPVANLKLTHGLREVSCVRLSAKGLYRWYAKCCQTPIGNTLGPAAPFIGLIHSFIANVDAKDESLGKSRGYIQTKHAIESVPTEAMGSELKLIARSLVKMGLWKLRGLSKPSVFFDDDGSPIVTPEVLSN